MSWGLGWKRPTEVFHLTLQYCNPEILSVPASPESPTAATDSTRARLVGDDRTDPDGSKTIGLGWTAGDDEDQIALRLQSQLMVRMPSPRDTVVVELCESKEDSDNAEDTNVSVQIKVVTRRELLRAVRTGKAVGSGQASDGVGVLTKLLRSSFSPAARQAAADAANINADPGGGAFGGDGLTSFADHWKSVTELNLHGCGISVLRVEVTELPLLEKLYLDNNRLSLLPPELGDLKNLKVLSVDNNMLVSVPVKSMFDW